MMAYIQPCLFHKFVLEFFDDGIHSAMSISKSVLEFFDDGIHSAMSISKACFVIL